MGQARASISSGLGLGVGLGLYGTAIAGVRAFVDALSGGIQGAIEEEKGIVKLTTALQANVAGWDGNTEAIEATIKSRMALAFTDDELRASLATLVTRSGDVEQAFRDQALAMDFARFKGVGLEEASVTIAKALQGNLRALKELGIVLPKGASEMAIFGAVSEKVAGQAKAFAETTEGAVLGMNIAIDEAFESIGQELLPVIRDFAVFVRDDLVPMIKATADALGFMGEKIDDVGRALDPLRGQQQDLTDAIGASARALDITREEWMGYSDAMTAAGVRAGSMEEAVRLVEEEVDRQRNTLALAKSAMGLFGDATERSTGKVEDATKRMGGFFSDLFGTVKDATGGVVREVADLMPSMADKIADGRQALRDVMSDVRWIIKNPNAWQDLENDIARAIEKLNTRRNRELAKGNAAAVRDIDNTLRYLRSIQGTFVVNIQVGGSAGSVGTSRNPIRRAAGGPTWPGPEFLVGENGPERFRMRSGTSGYVSPMTATSGNTTVTHKADPSLISALARAGLGGGDIADFLRNMGREGGLPVAS